jgi:hypothetical protein
VAPERERPSAWGDPAPVPADAGESTWAAAEENRPDGTEEAPHASIDGGYQDAGGGSHGWEAVAPVLVSDNGSGPVSGGSPAEPGWPLGAGHAATRSPREHRVLRGIRSGVALTFIALALGVAGAAGLGLIVWLIATAIHHAAAN